jgi:hypothetical protein
MLVCMRTTINLPDALAEEAKRRARASGRTFTSLVVEGLRRVLAEERTGPQVPELPAYGEPNGRPLVDISNRVALDDVLDADGFR